MKQVHANGTCANTKHHLCERVDGCHVSLLLESAGRQGETQA
jgi:hypothetical protein